MPRIHFQIVFIGFMIAGFLPIRYGLGDTTIHNPCLISDSYPAFAVRFSDNTFRIFSTLTAGGEGIWTYSGSNLEATVRAREDHQWELSLHTKAEGIMEVHFPWQGDKISFGDTSDDYLYYPFLCGTVERCDSFQEWNWGGLEYPGSCFSPLMVMADSREGLLVAASNWPPRKVYPCYSLGRMTLRYDEKVGPNQSQTYRMILFKVEGNPAQGRYPWQLAVDLYKVWLQSQMSNESLYPVRYAEWMQDIHGFLSCQLENYKDFDIQKVEKTWNAGRSIFPWIQFWGQMSDYALKPGGGCCLLEKSIHPRYQPGLVSMAQRLSTSVEGYHIGYYCRPDSSLGVLDPGGGTGPSKGLAFMLDWMSTLQKSYYANAFYLDTLGAVYYGDPLFVAKLFNQQIPANTFIEFPVDIYPAAYLISGSMGGAYQKYGWGTRLEELEQGKIKITFPRFGRYLLDDRIVFLGEENGDYVFWGSENQYRLEREVFLLGAKYSVMHLAESLSKPDQLNTALSLGLSERATHSWWSRRPIYQDTREVYDIPASIEVRRFYDQAGKTLFAIDNWSQIKGQRFRFKNQNVLIPTERLSIIELP